MAYSNFLLLLLIGVTSTHLPEVHTRPTDFWCKHDTRRKMMEMIEVQADCVGSDTLPSPVQLPCVGVHAVQWANKTLQQKHAEVLEALQVFQDGVQGVRNQATVQCQTSLLQKLEHSITNYRSIVNRLQIQNAELTPSHFAVQNCSSQTSLNKVLTQYRKLLSGKLERLAVDLHDIVCREEQNSQ